MTAADSETTDVVSNEIKTILNTITEEDNSVILHHNQIYEASCKLLNFFEEFLLQNKQYFNLRKPRPSQSKKRLRTIAIIMRTQKTKRP